MSLVYLLRVYAFSEAVSNIALPPRILTHVEYRVNENVYSGCFGCGDSSQQLVFGPPPRGCRAFLLELAEIPLEL